MIHVDFDSGIRDIKIDLSWVQGRTIFFLFGSVT